MPAAAHSLPRRGLAVAPAVALAAAALLSAPAVAGPAAAGPGLDRGLTTTGRQLQSVVVSGASGAADLVRRAVLSVGGSGVRPLPIVDGVSAEVPADQLSRLSRLPGVTAVTKDRAITLAGNGWDDSTTSSSYAVSSGASSLWPAASGGSGVTVAVLDTGVSQVNDLSGRLLNGPDLSGENRNAVDSYGHGTVMAGIVAGSGADSQPSPRTGVAPGAQIVSVKVAGANGATDVSTVLAGLSWVGAFKDVYNIRVLNLSFGVPSTQDPRIDPLNYAVERLWVSGVTVVVAAGNSGPAAGTIQKPGDDPLVVTVGAYDDRGDLVTTNDSIPAWSSQGPTARGLAKPDVVAPGRTLIAPRAPGSTVETENPKALVAPSYIKGSGTSEATAVVSGVAALLLAAHPSWTPDQVKHALLSTASPITGVAKSLQGYGRVQAAAANQAGVLLAPVQLMNATGLGSLAASRGSMAPVTVTCNGATKVLDDETTSWCAPWLGTAWTGTAWTGTAWTGTAWTGTAWTGTAWTGTAWTSTTWNGTAWTGTAWTGTAWTGTAWTGTAWTGTAWTGAVYDTEDTAFLTAWWGQRPRWWQHVPGEVSENPPGHGRERS